MRSSTCAGSGGPAGSIRALLVTALLLLAAFTDGHAQPGSARWVVERFLDRGGFPERAAYLTGEMAEYYAGAATLGAGLPERVRIDIRPLREGETSAAYTAALRDERHAQDWYFFLDREATGWKLAAVRTLALPPLFQLLLDSAAAQPALTAERAVTLGEMRLTVRSDSALRAHFTEHAHSFARLAALVAAEPSLTRVNSDGRGRPEGAGAALVPLLRELHVGAFSRSGEHPGCLIFPIGGMLDNEVGYLHAPPSCRVPEMSPDRFIYVEQVAPGWFLYKTT